MVSVLIRWLWPEDVPPSETPRKFTIVGLEGVNAKRCGVVLNGASVETALRTAVMKRVNDWLVEERRLQQFVVEERQWVDSYEPWKEYRNAVLQAVWDITFVRRDAYRREVAPRQWALEAGE
ncbi:hypothetical protein Q8F55_002976 [Vanrija albida]|uniref:Uncharacterized protein n=1 Tax=Vanrija albida TaxID=181172 RepID=A0ABR3QBB1_9TREE